MTQQEALQILKAGHNVYLTGEAGSGKTYVLNEYIGFLKARGVAVGVTASTGIAATHLGGLTIHAWSGIGIRDRLLPADYRHLAKRHHIRRSLTRAKVLVIDEVSMLHAHQLDMVDAALKMLRSSARPFGGLQVVLAGDFFQLPPVSKAPGQPAQFVTAAQVWPTMGLKVCYLTEQYRQPDERYLKVLNAIRSGVVDEAARAILRERQQAPIFGQLNLTRLYTHNVDVAAVNQRQLAGVPKTEKRFYMQDKGPRPLVEMLKRGYLAPAELALKEGALVMFLKNDFKAGYVNGTLGRVNSLKAGGPVVEILNGGQRIKVEPASWTIQDEAGQIKAKITQLPLRLAWAITVHKSQGMSLDAAEIDLAKAFELGMGYVALSRVRTLKGLRLVGLNEMALRVSPAVLTMDGELRRLSVLASRELGGLSEFERKKRERVFMIKLGVKTVQEG